MAERKLVQANDHYGNQCDAVNKLHSECGAKSVKQRLWTFAAWICQQVSRHARLLVYEADNLYHECLRRVKS